MNQTASAVVMGTAATGDGADERLDDSTAHERPCRREWVIETPLTSAAFLTSSKGRLLWTALVDQVGGLLTFVLGFVSLGELRPALVSLPGACVTSILGLTTQSGVSGTHWGARTRAVQPDEAHGR